MRIGILHTSIITAMLSISPIAVYADVTPTISPTVNVTTTDGTTDEGITTYSGSAPVTCAFKANVLNQTGWDAHYEWHFYTEGNAKTPYLIRYEENTSYTFKESGSHYVQLYATFTKGGESITWQSEDTNPITITISESKLEMPNAFSPNDDGVNDIYKAKKGYQSIVEFKAYIFNRWGQKLYEWNDPAEGWDGTFRGQNVKEGVYFVLVKAKGADGRTFNIRKDVNLLRGYSNAHE
ncbi:gliding motility-associated C-terminal domain-containing protein [Prevotella sp. S7 MS 2]|uniref:gliding motility-associated C-terminal domain-containing protein n=1 Tax=Prevotella sp. S7 MS 2 TaxID=1287488 RepID=UPI0005144ED8|nr:T9SS C-terminal target domain-containing protein [Prevotella sp. S7 MS 2]KGI59441.1 gliding motility protein [Prevotella sp. S7 MS 2]